MDILDSILGAGGSVLGSLASGVYNYVQSDRQRRWSEEMMNKQNAWNLEQWNREVDYDSPANRVQRLRDAGLNPLYYGLDGASSPALESSQPLGYESARLDNVPNPVLQGLQAAQAVANISNIQANTSKTNNENLTETVKREKMQAEILTVQQELKNKLAEEGLTDVQRKQIEKGLEWADRLNQAVVSEKDSVVKLNDSQRKRIDDLLDGEKLIQSRTLQDFEFKWRKIEAEISKMSAEEDILVEDLANYALNHANSGFLGTGASLPNLIRALIGIKPKVGEENKFGEGNEMADLIRSGQ